MRIFYRSYSRDAYEFEHFFCSFHGFFLCAVVMKLNYFSDLIAYGKNRVQSGHGILEYHGDIVASYGLHLFFCLFQKVFALKVNLSLNYFSRRIGNKPENAQRRRRLSGACFSYKSKRIAGLKRQVDAVHGADISVHRIVMNMKVLYLKQTHFPSPPYRFSFGSIASRSPSPKRLKPKIVRIIAMPGNMTTMGCCLK